MARIAGWAAVLLLCALAGFVVGEVMELTDDNIQQYIRQSPDLLVFGCARGKAPVCNFIQSFIPELEDFIASTMPDGFEAGEVHLPTSPVTAKDVQLKMGEFVLFRDGTVHSRKLVETKEDLFEWLESHASREIKEITSKEQFDSFVDGVDHKHATVIIFGGSPDDSLHEQLLEFSHVYFDSFYVRAIYDQSLINTVLPSPADRAKNVWVYRHFEHVQEPDLGFTATEDGWEDLRHNLMMHGSPLIHLYDKKETLHMAALTKEAVIIVHIDEADDTTLELITHVAAENDRYKRVGIFWHYEQILNEQMKRMEMDEYIGSLPFAVATTKGQRDVIEANMSRLFPVPFFWDTSKEFTRENFAKWVDDIIEERLDFRDISQNESELADEGSVKHFSRKSLQRLVSSSHKDVVLAYIGPVGICGGECHVIKQTLAEVQSSYPYKERLEFGFIDASRNFVGDMGGRFPGIVLVRNNGGTVLPFDQPYRDSRSLGRWLDGFYKPKHRAHDEF